MTREEIINKLGRRTAYDFEHEAASMLQRDGETIAALEAERDQLLEHREVLRRMLRGQSATGRMEPLDFYGAYYRGTQAVQCKLCGSEIAESRYYYRISGYNVCEAHYNEWYRRVENAKSRVADQFAEAMSEGGE